MATLNANDLTLDEVHSLLNLQGTSEPSPFTDLLTFEPLTNFEQQEMRQIRDDFLYYLTTSKVLEGQVQFLVLAPLLRLAGFYHSPLRISLEQGIARINITDKDTSITGRMDILATKKQAITNLWILVIEAKNSAVAALTGLPQLLTYAYTSLEQQETVWGLTTNGEGFRFVCLQAGKPATYALLPEVNLIDLERAFQLLQVLKAICRL